MNYTPEKLDNLADKLEDPSYGVEEMTQYAESAAPALRAYATTLRQQAEQSIEECRMSKYTPEQYDNMATNVRDCAWPDEVKEYMVLIEPMLRAAGAAIRQRSEVDGRDWLHLRAGVVVGTSRPDYENGRYVRIGKLPSEGGIYARPEQAPEIFPGTSDQLNSLSIKGETP